MYNFASVYNLNLNKENNENINYNSFEIVSY